MNTKQEQPTFVPVPAASDILGLPARWLTEQLETGSLPGLRVGRSWRVDPDALRELLAERAARAEGVRR